MAERAYSEDNISQMYRALDTTQRRYNDLLSSFGGRQYKTPRAHEFATQGFLRRFDTMRRCLGHIFGILPPETVGIPDEDRLKDTAIQVQSFLFNVFGCLDNLAWVWVLERGIKKPNGGDLPPSAIGFGSKCETVRASLSQDFRHKLDGFQDWFATVESYRHALAHRIPLYIPPYAVTPDNKEKYQQLQKALTDAQLKFDRDATARIEAEIEPLKFFRPFVLHSVREDPPLALHPQCLADFNTVEDIAWKMRAELDLP